MVLLKRRGVLTLVNVALLIAAIVSGLMLARNAISVAYKGGVKETFVSGDGKAGEKQAAKGLFDYAPILSNNVFGFPAGELRPLDGGPEKAAAAAPVPANVSLMGVVSWSMGFGYAVIADKATGAQEVYKTGEEIAGLGKLKKVEKDRIVVESGGKPAEIMLEELASVKEIRKAEAAPVPGQPPGDFVKKAADGSYLVDQRALQTALENPKQIMTDARLLPNMVDGKQDGFIVREIKKGGMYEGLGLKNGDVLLKVNDFNISDPETALQAFTALKGMDRIELDIMRDGSKTSLTYMIR